MTNTIKFEDAYFKDKKYSGFALCFERPISINGKIWDSVIHYVAVMEFDNKKFQKYLHENSSSLYSGHHRAIAKQYNAKVRKNWDKVQDDYMFKATLAKFTQHSDLKASLLATNDAQLIFHNNGSHWGNGGDGSGKNRLGQILMKVREELRKK